MKVVFSDRAYTGVLAETTEKIKTETGGLFLGTYEDGVWYIIETIDPGPKSIFEVAYFEYDQAYTQHLINKIANLYDTRLSLIGLWHRHPGSFDQFSSTDDGTNSKYAKINEHGAISALANIDPAFRLTMYHVNSLCRYTKIDYEVGNQLIPDRLLAFKSPLRFTNLMNNIISFPNGRNKGKYHCTVSLGGFIKFIEPYLESKTCDKIESDSEYNEVYNEKMLDILINDITYLSEERKIEFTIEQKEQYICLIQDSLDKPIKLYFTYSELNESTVLSYDDKCYLYNDSLFKEAYEAMCKLRNSQNYEDSFSSTLKSAVLKMINKGTNGDE